MAPKTKRRPGPPKTKYAQPPRRKATPRPPSTVPERRTDMTRSAAAGPPPATAAASKKSQADEVLEEEKSILDLIDNLLNQGVVLSGELILGVAGVDLVYLRLNALLAAADRVLPQSRATNASARAVPRNTGPRPLLPSDSVVDAD